MTIWESNMSGFLGVTKEPEITGKVSILGSKVERVPIQSLNDNEEIELDEDEAIERARLLANRQSSVQTKRPEVTADFLDEARKLVDAGEAKTMTEAMRKVQCRRPELHEAFKAESRSSQQSVGMRQFQSNHKFRALVERHSLAIEQSERARKAGHLKVAEGTLAVAEDICREIRQLLREDKYAALLAKRGQVTEKLHKAVIGGGDAKQLGEQLAGIDRQLEVL